jgi:hypothetical protein
MRRAVAFFPASPYTRRIKKNKKTEDGMDKLSGFFTSKYVIGFGAGGAALVIGYRAYKSKKLGEGRGKSGGPGHQTAG